MTNKKETNERDVSLFLITKQKSRRKDVLKNNVNNRDTKLEEKHKMKRNGVSKTKLNVKKRR